jgi:hypothetical protein
MFISPEVLVRTAAKWNITRELALEVIGRDLTCIYCRRNFDADLSGPRKGLPTWEHVVNDLLLVSSANIALCCWGCNASKGRKTLQEWLRSDYCRVWGITSSSVAAIAAASLRRSHLAEDSLPGVTVPPAG